MRFTVALISGESIDSDVLVGTEDIWRKEPRFYKLDLKVKPDNNWF